jgi:hypothetical protein
VPHVVSNTRPSALPVAALLLFLLFPVKTVRFIAAIVSRLSVLLALVVTISRAIAIVIVEAEGRVAMVVVTAIDVSIAIVGRFSYLYLSSMLTATLRR